MNLHRGNYFPNLSPLDQNVCLSSLISICLHLVILKMKFGEGSVIKTCLIKAVTKETF